MAGNVYVADTHSIRKITSQGLVTTLAGGLIAGNADGVGTAASFDYIFGLATDVSGNVYVADYFNNKIRKVSPAGVVTTFAGSGVQGKSDGPAAVASFFGPTSIAIDSHGTIYVSDSQNGLIRKITSEGVVSSLAGSGHFGNVDGTGTSASFGSTLSIAIDKSDYLYVSDEDNNSIRKITPTGVVTTFSALIGFDHPGGLTLDVDGNLFVADIMNQQIKKVTPAGLVSTLAGRGPGLNTDVDGIGIAANFYLPVDISRDTSGTLYVVDAGANLIRKITAQ
ncbi:hypothetical protein GCM10011396_38800 [Undibacterium terreum]|uniref:NHL repeat-containing protein n=1 Tax=Undibacterium terreum TaxID=1224302 RepID=A0A916UTZ5_9BURK|nr:hypothetical protein GCM10011396_38800 [Undibacterium terreum]